MKIIKKQSRDLRFGLYCSTVICGIIYLTFGIFLPQLSMTNSTFLGVLFFALLCSVPFVYGAWTFFKFYFVGEQVKEPIDDWAKYRWN